MIILIISAIIIFCGFFLFKKQQQKNCHKFLIENSIAINNLIDLNKKYYFYNDFVDFQEKKIYDNEKFFDAISCEDFLIYQLALKQDFYIKELKKIEHNIKISPDYYLEVGKIYPSGKYAKNTKINRKLLLREEEKLFKQYILKPPKTFAVRITLFCSRLNGKIYKQKYRVFSTEEISILIQRLNNKTNNFYNDKEIWNSLCRVERGIVSNKMRFAIYERDGYKCQICGKGKDQDFLEIDHIKPISKGGKSTYDNLQTLCRTCNKNKSDRY